VGFVIFSFRLFFCFADKCIYSEAYNGNHYLWIFEYFSIIVSGLTNLLKEEIFFVFVGIGILLSFISLLINLDNALDLFAYF
jgi:hypothetical protein